MKSNPKILLCALNSKFIHSCLAVYSLKKYAVKAGYETEKILIKEFTINDTLDYILEGIFSTKADAVAFSVYIWNVEYVSKLCRILKKISPETTIILGGPEVTYTEKHPYFDEGDFDFILRGEGEKSFYSLITAGEITDEKIISLDDIPFPYDEENIHLFRNRIVYYESSRGCPFSCAYCLSSAENGVRFLSLDRVKSDLEFFEKHGVKQVKFIDRTFNCNRDRAYEIWEFIITNFSCTDMNFHFEIAADLLDEKLMRILDLAPDGLIQLEIGIQSTDEETLTISCRKTDTEKVLGNTKKLIERGNINIHADLIAGLPGESLEKFRKSFNDVYPLQSHQLQLGFLKILHGTRMEEISKKFDFVFSPFSPYEILSNKDMSHDDILFLKKFEDVFEKIYNSQRFILSLKVLEKHFESPFEVFEKITEFFEENSLSFVSVSTREIYNILHRFFGEKISSDTKAFDEKLLSDFYFSEKSELVPEELKYLLPPHKVIAEKAPAILRSLNLHKYKGMAVRFVSDKIFIVNYSQKGMIVPRFLNRPYSELTSLILSTE